MQVHLVDGTYELFRHHFGRPALDAADHAEVGATRGVLSSVLSMLEGGATHIGVATDHVVESFRNELWPGYKTSEGMPPELLAQFPLLEEGLEALGVVVWAMVDAEADDALASAAVVAEDDGRVQQVRIYTPDKDLAQCVRGQRVVQLDRRADVVVDEQGVWDKYGVAPLSIPDWLALVGDSADGFPGIAGWGKKTAATVLAHYGSIDAIPDDDAAWDPAVLKGVRGAPKLAARLAEDRGLAELFRVLATLRIERELLASVDDLEWTGPAAALEEFAARVREPRLVVRAATVAKRRRGGAVSE